MSHYMSCASGKRRCLSPWMSRITWIEPRAQRNSRNGKFLMEGKASCGVVLLLAITLIGCRQSPREPVALQYAYSWNEDRPQERALLQRFTQETGIRVTNIPIP